MVQLNRGTLYYQPTKPDDSVIKGPLTELAADHPRWGAKKMTAVIRNQGNQVNHKRIQRICREMQLNIRIKPQETTAQQRACPPDRARKAQSILVGRFHERCFALRSTFPNIQCDR